MAVLRTYILLALVTIAVTQPACSDDPFCGDGKLNNPEEQCDDGNQDDTDFCLSTCKARQLSRLFVKWEFNSDPELGFSGDSCIEMGASTVEVELTGGPEPVDIITENCSSFQAAFVDIPAADYTIKIRVYDRDGAAISSEVSENRMFGGGNSTEILTIPADAWTGSYVGDFFFRVSWAGADCGDALPVLTDQRLTLVADGNTIFTTTEGGATLDGSSSITCVPLTVELPQVARDVPFGPAQFKIEGLDAMGMIIYEEIFDTFVGAGVSNPVLEFDVDLVPTGI